MPGRLNFSLHIKKAGSLRTHTRTHKGSRWEGSWSLAGRTICLPVCGIGGVWSCQFIHLSLAQPEQKGLGRSSKICSWTPPVINLHLFISTVFISSSSAWYFAHDGECRLWFITLDFVHSSLKLLQKKKKKKSSHLHSVLLAYLLPVAYFLSLHVSLEEMEVCFILSMDLYNQTPDF